MSPLSVSQLAKEGSHVIHDAFSVYRDEFSEVTRMARDRFIQRNWAGLRADGNERLGLYSRHLRAAVQAIESLLRDRREDKMVWVAMKAVYSESIATREDWELAETFYNSVTRQIFDTMGVDPDIEFVDTDFDTPPTPPSPVYHAYTTDRDMSGLITRLLKSAAFNIDEDHIKQASEEIATRIDARLREAGALLYIDRVELMDGVFYRGQRAHLVARYYSGLHVFPLVIVLLHGESGIRVEAALLHENDVSILFSFTRSYFHVHTSRPSDIIRFLRSLMPRKRVAELYNSIGCNKHGKTEFYRDLLRQLRVSDARFEHAPGTPGMVMASFAMPGYDVIFKIIRDEFPPPKATTREQIQDKYRLVFRHDRAGRLVEAQSFEHLEFFRKRFSKEVLDELGDECGRSVTLSDTEVTFDHLYVERQVIPLNVFLSDAAPGAAEAAIVDFGQAIKDLAATNIFPGDILTKNFGVTRNGRVVFYDYDELELLENCTFRRMPPPRTEEEVMSSEPWFTVGENDIFPEEFRVFMGIPVELRDLFEEVHGDLFDAEWWKQMQAQATDDHPRSVVPFSSRCLLEP